MNNPIKVKKEGSVLEVTIDRPKANAIDSKTSIILGEVFADFRDDSNLRVAILTGAGEKFFSAGWDLKAVNEGEQPDADYGIGVILNRKNKNILQLNNLEFSKIKFSDYFNSYKKFMNLIEYEDLIKII